MNTTLTESELEQLTGYSSPLKQLDVLHQRGFSRAYRDRHGKIILSREHFKAVERGEFANNAQAPVKINYDFLEKA
jgi:hypothetical protein